MERRDLVMKRFLRKEQDSGTQRTSCFSSFDYGDNLILYSYGYHFELARFTGMFDENGKEILIVNNYSYSVTTSKMQGDFMKAVSGARITDTYRVVFAKYCGTDFKEGVKTECEDRLSRRVKDVSLPRGAHEVETAAHVIRDAVLEYEENLKLFGFEKEELPDLGTLESVKKSNLTDVAMYLVEKGVEAFDSFYKKLPVKFLVLYKLMGGVGSVENKKVRNPIINYFKIVESGRPEIAIPLLNSDYRLVQEAARELLTKGAA
jgi:hypothetical protein